MWVPPTSVGGGWLGSMLVDPLLAASRRVGVSGPPPILGWCFGWSPLRRVVCGGSPLRPEALWWVRFGLVRVWWVHFGVVCVCVCLCVCVCVWCVTAWACGAQCPWIPGGRCVVGWSPFGVWWLVGPLWCVVAGGSILALTLLVTPLRCGALAGPLRFGVGGASLRRSRHVDQTCEKKKWLNGSRPGESAGVPPGIRWGSAGDPLGIRWD